MAVGTIPSTGKKGRTSTPYNLMTVQAVRYGYSATFSVLTTATSIQGLYDDINSGNTKERWIICHTNANANLTSPNHQRDINIPSRLEIVSYGSNNLRAIRITGQTIKINYENGYLDNEASPSMYILPFGGGTIYDNDVASATILHIQELI